MTDELLLGARNPRALAEAVLGRPIDWARIPDPRAFLEDVLATPYEELFDPRHDSPTYLGLAVDEAGRVVPERPRFARAADPRSDDRPGNDLERFPELDLAAVRRLADLKTLLGCSIEDLPVRAVAAGRAGGLALEVGAAPQARLAELARIFPESVLSSLWADVFIDTGWTPAGGQWADIGSFFHETAEFFDPIQKGLADCWLVSAMSSVAWAMPYAISQRTRATGTADDAFVNLIELTDPANGAVQRYELTDRTVVHAGTTTPMYSHSSEPGELWPAVIEKAFANWRRGTSTDRPDLTALNYGDCVHASAAITGRKPHYTATAASTTGALISLVKANSVNHRTVNPMTAWTYGTAPAGLDYASADIVANHCYSVLGWVRGSQLHLPQLDQIVRTRVVDGLRAGGIGARVSDLIDSRALLEFFARDYVVLRNPWGWCEASTGNLTGPISMRDVSFWRTIDLDVSDGVFAIDLPTFKRYFAGIGVAL